MRPAHLGHRCPLAFERERRRTRRYPQPANLGQHVQQFVRQAIREILVLLVAAHVDERQHCDGLRGIDRVAAERRKGLLETRVA